MCTPVRVAVHGRRGSWMGLSWDMFVRLWSVLGPVDCDEARG